MAAKIGVPVRTKSFKKTSIGRKNRKMSSMNKSKKASYKKYRGQG
jgi:hypothetical protein